MAASRGGKLEVKGIAHLSAVLAGDEESPSADTSVGTDTLTFLFSDCPL